MVRTENTDMRSYVCLLPCQHLSCEEIRSTLCATEAIFCFLVFYLTGSLQQMKSYKRVLLALLDNDTKRSIGHQAEDFILECNWKGEVCGPE